MPKPSVPKKGYPERFWAYVMTKMKRRSFILGLLSTPMVVQANVLDYVPRPSDPMQDLSDIIPVNSEARPMDRTYIFFEQNPRDGEPGYLRDIRIGGTTNFL